MPFVLQFWWSCPFCCVSLPVGGCVWHWSFVAGHCCWCLSLMPRAFSMLGCLLLLGHGVVALAFVLWGLSFGALGLLLSLPSRWLRLPFVQWPSAASAYGWCCVLRFGSSSSFNLLLLLLFFFSFSSGLGCFFFVCLCSLVSFLLPLPGVWPSLVLGLFGPT